jgi:hypothetical protein
VARYGRWGLDLLGQHQVERSTHPGRDIQLLVLGFSSAPFVEVVGQDQLDLHAP